MASRLILDANMLVVYIIGLIDPNLLGRTKRVKEYRFEDYGLLVDHISQFRDMILIPNVVTEASNLLDHLTGTRREEAMTLLAGITETTIELYITSSTATTQAEYAALGITDAALLSALDADTHLLTADFKLYVAAMIRCANAELFDNLRS